MSRQEYKTQQSTDTRPVSRSSVDQAAEQEYATVGTYHPKAGTRNAGGVAVFVRQMTRNFREERETYLYTEDGSVASEMDADGTVVPIEGSPGWESLRSALGYSPLTLGTVSNQLSESVASLVEARLDGTLDHIERNVDVLYTHTLLDTFLLSNVLSTPVVRVFHGCKQTSKMGSILTDLSRPAATIANSSQTANEVDEKLDHTVEWTVYPGVDLDAFDPDRRPAFDREEVTILFVGRFVESKGTFDLIEAFGDLPDRTHLYLAGRGNTDRVERELREHDVRDRVTVLGDTPYDELPRYYAAADVACLPSHYESFAMVNVEAMACGTPVVTTDVPGVRHYAEDGVNCLLVPPGDTEQLREALATLVESEQRRREIGRAGHSVAERFSWQSTAEKLGDVADTIHER